MKTRVQLGLCGQLQFVLVFGSRIQRIWVLKQNPVLGPFFREYGLSFLAGFRIGNLFLVVLPLQDERSHLWPDFPENVLTKFRFSSSSISTEFL